MRAGESQPGSYKITERPGCTASRHDTALAYQVDRCRCPDAIEAQGIYRRRLRWRHHRGLEPRIDATGTLRRIHALQAIGWPRAEILRRLGHADCGTWITKATRVSRRTAHAVHELYDLLADTPGPSPHARSAARTAGWLEPIWWDDDLIDDPNYDPRQIRPQAETQLCTPDVDAIAIDRYLAGDTSVRLTKAEKSLAVQRLLDLGYGVTQIADRMRMSGESARKWIERAREMSGREASIETGKREEAAS